MKIAFIGQIKNKQTGLGKAINDTLVYLKENTEKLEEIDITDNKKFISSIRKILKSEAELYYFTPSGSIFGNIRDTVYLFVMISRKRKIITHFHNSAFGKVIESNIFIKLINKYIYSKVNKIIVLGEKSKDMFKLLGVEDSKFEIVRNGIDEYLFIEPKKLSEKFLSNRRNIVFFSNMIEAKGYNIVLNLAKKMENNHDFNFYFSGKFFDEKLEKKFKNEISSLTNVEYISGVYSMEKKYLLEKMHYFILPSYYKDETLPISMLEAMANGLYIIVSDVGVISEVVNKETSRLLTKIDDETEKEIENIILESSNCLDKLDFKIDSLAKYYSNRQIQIEIFKIIKKIIKENKN